MLKREQFLGYNFIIADSIKNVAEEIMTQTIDGTCSGIPLIFTPNVDYVVKLNKAENKSINDRLKGSAYIFPDGQPIVWAARYYKRNIKHRLTGSDLFVEMYDIAKTNNVGTLLLTSSESTSNFYKQDYPGAYSYTLPFIQPNDSDAFDKVIHDSVALIIRNKLKLVFIGVSFPKQDKIALGIYDVLKAIDYPDMPTIGLLGASLEFKAGIKKRAPIFFQEIGLEWFHRFLKEPRRLFKRYFIDCFKFLSIVRSNNSLDAEIIHNSTVVIIEKNIIKLNEVQEEFVPKLFQYSLVESHTFEPKKYKKSSSELLSVNQ